MAKQLNVKAILQYPEGLELGSSPDVRRFKVPKGSDSDGDVYRHLADALPTVFPDISGLSYSLFWKDDDDDLILISTTEELQNAIDNMSDNLLRVFIIVDFDETGDTTGTGSESEGGKTPKRVRFLNAGKKWRRRLRRRRQAALADREVVSKEYRKGVRLLIKQLHRLQKASGKGGKPKDDQEETTLAALSPEVQAFVRRVFEDWHTKLTQKRPRVVAKKIRREKRTLPTGLEKEHFRWLCRFMARWHRRHAVKCDVMAGWSSGDTGDDTSGDEETLVKRHKKRRERRMVKKGEKRAASGVSDSEDTDGVETSDHTVAKDFRKDVRVMMARLHKKKTTSGQETTSLAALSPEVQGFIQKLADDWHAMLSKKRPRVVAKKMQKEKRSLPSGLEEDHFRWLCRFMARWHRRHAHKCDVMSGWSSGETSGEEDETARAREKKQKRREKKGEKPGESGLSDSEDTEKGDDTVSKEFRKGIRVLVNQLHKKKKASAKADKPTDEQEQATLAAVSPEVKAFVQDFVQEWHTQLSKKPPRLVAKRMRKERSLPPGLEKDHFQWICRLMARWHRKHAGKCDVMSGWSSGETGDDTSGDEDASPRRRGKRGRFGKHGESGGLSESEDTDCLEKACKPVSKEFRTEVRTAINQLHKKKKLDGKGDKPRDGKEKATPSTLSPEVLKFLEQFSEDWHSRLSHKRPRAVSKEMKEEERSLPSRMEREQYTWLCCFMARWHRKHAEKCDVMSGWSSGAVAGAEA